MCSQISVALKKFDYLIVNVEVRLRSFLLGLILNIHEVQWDDNILREFCNTALDLDSMTNSSAYTSEFNFVPLVKQRDQIKFFRKSMVYK